MLAVFFIAGMVLSGSLAYAGLVRRSLKLSKDTTLIGATARAIGVACLLVMLALLGLSIWAILMIVKPR